MGVWIDEWVEVKYVLKDYIAQFQNVLPLRHGGKTWKEKSGAWEFQRKNRFFEHASFHQTLNKKEQNSKKFVAGIKAVL